MAYGEDNLAYDLSLFEERPPQEKRQKNTRKNPKSEVRAKENSKSVKTKKNPLTRTSFILVLIIAIATAVMMLCGQAELTELNQKISNAQTELSEKESVYIQTEMKVEAVLSAEMVEHYAEDILGMTKVDNTKKEFIKLSEGDQVTVIQKENKSFANFLSDKINSMWE